MLDLSIQINSIQFINTINIASCTEMKIAAEVM
jgi:hypothetical protein